MQPKIALYNRLIAATAILFLIPIWAFNLAFLLRKKSITKTLCYVDALHRQVHIKHFRYGILKRSLALLSVLHGRVALVGVSLHEQLTTLDMEKISSTAAIPAGFISTYTIASRIGLQDKTHAQLITEHTENYTFSYNMLILIKALMSYATFSNKNLKSEKKFHLFGISIDNLNYQEAISHITSNPSMSCKKGYFLNVNSINQCFDNPDLVEILNSGDNVFCDGSGVRLAAQHLGYKLVANLNGTDLLSPLCKTAEEKGLSIYILGGKSAITQIAITNLKTQFPKLKIAGSHHGYFSEDESSSIIAEINRTGADICLVALGTPIQESWIHLNASRLQCQYALAVGGLLDFVANRFTRAPRWIRELGMEWLWRLAQEPQAKFYRYAIGNPLFLYRTFILKMDEKSLWDIGTKFESNK